MEDTNFGNLCCTVPLSLMSVPLFNFQILHPRKEQPVSIAYRLGGPQNYLNAVCTPAGNQTTIYPVAQLIA
jgi:hypothetical protein